jgi:uncharacterized Tic20 family protein
VKPDNSSSLLLPVSFPIVGAVNVALVLKYVEVELIDRQGKEAHGYHSSLDIYILSHQLAFCQFWYW